jgi:hypothetical protein
MEITARAVAKLNSTEMDFWRRSARISRKDNIRNNITKQKRNVTKSLLDDINPLKPELNPICYLLALLAHHFLYVSRIRVKSLTLRLITRPEESYRLWCVVVCDLETSRIGAPYIYDISHLRVKTKQLQWYGHIQRMEEGRLPKEVMK